MSKKWWHNRAIIKEKCFPTLNTGIPLLIKIRKFYLVLVNHSRLKSGACENCPSGATTTICLDTALACKQVLRAIYQSLYGPQVARRTYYLDTR